MCIGSGDIALEATAGKVEKSKNEIYRYLHNGTVDFFYFNIFEISGL